MRKSEARRVYQLHADEPRHVDLTAISLCLALVLAAGLLGWLFGSLVQFIRGLIS